MSTVVREAREYLASEKNQRPIARPSAQRRAGSADPRLKLDPLLQQRTNSGAERGPPAALSHRGFEQAASDGFTVTEGSKRRTAPFPPQEPPQVQSARVSRLSKAVVATTATQYASREELDELLCDLEAFDSSLAGNAQELDSLLAKSGTLQGEFKAVQGEVSLLREQVASLEHEGAPLVQAKCSPVGGSTTAEQLLPSEPSALRDPNEALDRLASLRHALGLGDME